MARNTRKIRRTGGPSYGKGQSYKAGKPKSRKILTEGEKKDKLSERIRKKVMAKKPSAKKPSTKKSSAKKPMVSKKSLPAENKGRAMVKRGTTSLAESPKTGEYIQRSKTAKTTGRQGATINANRNHTKEFRADHPLKSKAGRVGRGSMGKALGRAAGAAGRLAGGLGAAYLAGQVAKKVTDAADKNLGYSGGGRKGRKGSSSSPKKTPASSGPSTRPNNKPAAKTGGASTSFSQAFAKARKARLAGGKETFQWNGKTYHSYQKGETPLKYQKGGEAKRTKEFATDPSYRPKGKNKPNK